MSDQMMVALIGLVGLVVTAMSQRNANKLKVADTKLNEIHVLVNRRLSEALEKIEALRAALTAEVARTERPVTTAELEAFARKAEEDGVQAPEVQ